MTFNFLGTLTEEDRISLSSWVSERYTLLQDIKIFYQGRAAQLRRSSGLLNKVMSNRNLKPSFNKDSITEPKGGFRLLTDRDDRLPAIIVSKIKDNFRDMLQQEDESIFQMNNLCVLIEKMEDEAYFSSISEDETRDLIVELEKLFSDPEYREVLISNSDQYNGEPRYRVDNLAPRTEYEKKLSPSMREE